MRKHRITSPPATRQSAYVANGFVGLRVGTNPFMEQSALLGGFTGSHERFGVDALAPIPAAQIDIALDGASLRKSPDGYRLIEQCYDFSCGELVTSFSFEDGRGGEIEGTNLIYCSRASPSLVIQETSLKARRDCDLRFSTLIDPSRLPIRTRLRVEPKADCDGVLWIESRDGTSCAGIATYLQCEAEGEFRETDSTWGYEQDGLTKTYGVRALPGKSYLFRMATSYVPSVLHSEPHWQAVRMIKLARWKGFAGLRNENGRAWAKLWESRIKIVGATEEWQDLVDASFFYLYSSIHPSSPQGPAPFGLSQRDAYKGHVFWDAESFMFALPLLTDPASARNMLEYRFDRIGAARHNAMINGLLGIQFPWQSGTTGDEVTRVSADGAGGAGELHVNPDVAMAFVAYSKVSGDEAFLRERAWPVVRGVAEWIESRVERTARGYEILSVTGIDEGSDDVDNDSFTNIICSMLLKSADRIAAGLGYPAKPTWRRIADGLFVPVDERLGYIEQYEGCAIRDAMLPESLMAFFPYGYSHGGAVDENTIRFLVEHDMRRSLSTPMLSGFLGIFPARLGDRRLARQFFDEGNLPFIVDPFMMSTERGANHADYRTASGAESTIFLTGRGSLLSALLLGLTRMDIWRDDVEDSLSGPIVMPEGWDGIVLEKVFLKGRAARVTAMHGAPKATIEWLEES